MSQGKGRKPPEGTKTEEGDSIGVVHRHEMSPADELGRCYPERVDVLQGSPFMQLRTALRLEFKKQSPKMTQNTNRRRAENKPVSQNERRFSQ